jgi:hypothetical protein
MLKQVTVVTSIMPLRNDPFSVYFPMSASNSDNVYDPPRHLFPDLHFSMLHLPECHAISLFVVLDCLYCTTSGSDL